MRTVLILLCLLLVGCGGCVMPPPPIPVPPAPPGPPEPPQPPPEPTGLTRASFDGVHLGDAAEGLLEALPPPSQSATLGSRSIYGWVLDELRPEGGRVWWEIHVEGGKVVASFAW